VLIFTIVVFLFCDWQHFVVILEIELLRHGYKSWDDCCFLVWLLAVMGFSRFAPIRWNLFL